MADDSNPYVDAASRKQNVDFSQFSSSGFGTQEKMKQSKTKLYIVISKCGLPGKAPREIRKFLNNLASLQLVICLVET